jgi:hypothetical protein
VHCRGRVVRVNGTTRHAGADPRLQISETPVRSFFWKLMKTQVNDCAVTAAQRSVSRRGGGSRAAEGRARRQLGGLAARGVVIRSAQACVCVAPPGLLDLVSPPRTATVDRAVDASPHPAGPALSPALCLWLGLRAAAGGTALSGPDETGTCRRVSARSARRARRPAFACP